MGIDVVFLARILGALYFINNIDDDELIKRVRKSLIWNTIIFLVFFLLFVFRGLLGEGFAVDPSNGEVFLQPYKYWLNFIEMPILLILFLVGVLLVLFGIIYTIARSTFDKGIWFVGLGTILTVLSLLLVAGYNFTAYYPSNADLQSSLTIYNSSSSLFTLKTMAWVSIWIPVVIIYIFYTWRKIDARKISEKEFEEKNNSSY